MAKKQQKPIEPQPETWEEPAAEGEDVIYPDEQEDGESAVEEVTYRTTQSGTIWPGDPEEIEGAPDVETSAREDEPLLNSDGEPLEGNDNPVTVPAEDAGEDPAKSAPKVKKSKVSDKSWHDYAQDAIDILGENGGETEVAGAVTAVYEMLDLPIPVRSIEWARKAGRILAEGGENAGNRARSALQVALASDGVGV